MTPPRTRHDWHLSNELKRQVERNPDARFIRMVDGPVCSFGEDVKKDTRGGRYGKRY